MRIDTAAMSSGTKASSEANTNASTASAPPAPKSVSANTPGPSLLPPLASWLSPVSPTCAPAGRAVATARLIATGSLGAPNVFSSGVNTIAYVERPSFVTKRRSPVTARSTIRARGAADRAF